MTKCGHASGLDLPNWDPKLVELSIERSLKRLQTDRVDVVQLHSCSEEILRQGDVIAALQRARDAGKTRFIGYSGDGDAALYAVECGAFDTLQTSLNIADQEPITSTLAKALAANMGVICKRPIAIAVWGYGSKKPDMDYHTTYWERLQAIGSEVFDKPENAAELALRFTLSQPGTTTAIVGTSDPDRWAANARLLEQGPLPDNKLALLHEQWLAAGGAQWRGQQ